MIIKLFPWPQTQIQKDWFSEWNRCFHWNFTGIVWTRPKSPKRGGFVRSQLLRITNIYFLLTISLHCQAHNWGEYEKLKLRINVFCCCCCCWMVKIQTRSQGLFPCVSLAHQFPAPKQRKSPLERGWQKSMTLFPLLSRVWSVFPEKISREERWLLSKTATGNRV